MAVIYVMPASAQTAVGDNDQDVAYSRTIIQRAEKIVKTLAITDSVQAMGVRDIIVAQYRSLNDVHKAHHDQVKMVKARKDVDKAAMDAEIKTVESETNVRLDKLHTQYLAALAAKLTPAQVEKVKDGMTYGVLPITYKGYLDMLPDLTEEQKKQILTYLTEAREHAMDAGSSEEKHHWFGKYKGKINNYLSAAGYDMKKAGEEWEKRRRKS